MWQRLLGTAGDGASRLGPSVWSYALVAIAVLIAIALRFANLDGVPPALNQDEAVSGYDAYSLLRTGRDHLGHPFPVVGLESFGDWVSPLLTFLTVPSVALFGLNVVALRIVSATVGVLLVPVIYLLATELFGRRSVGVVAAWVVALSPWHVAMSRWAIPPVMAPTMVALLLLTFVWSVTRRSSRGVVLTALIAGLTVAAYPTMKLYVPLLGLAVVVIYAPYLRRINREALVYAAVILLVIAGPIFYLSTQDPGGRARLEQVSAFSGRQVTVGYLSEQYAAYLSPRFLLEEGDRDPMHSPPGYGVVLWAEVPLLAVGLAWLAFAAAGPAVVRFLRIAYRRGTSDRTDAARAESAAPNADMPSETEEFRRASLDQRAALLVLVALALYPVPGSLTLPSPHTLRAIHLIPLLALTVAIGAVTLVRILYGFLKKERPALVWSAIVAIAALWAVWYGRDVLHRHRDYFESYPNTVLAHFQYGLEDVIAYAGAHEAEYDEIYIASTNQPYIYLLFYRGWSPSDVHVNLPVRRNPPYINWVYEFGKYRFSEPSEFAPADLTVVHTVPAPDGGVAYEVRGGSIWNGKRILFIGKPQ